MRESNVSSNHGYSHSSSHHHHSSGKRKYDEYRGLRNFFSFFLFLSIAALSVSSCIKTVFVNPKILADIFTNREYTYAVYTDVLEYAKDMCLECNIPADSVKEVITADSVGNIQNAYAEGFITDNPKYTETTYIDLIDELNKDLVSSTDKMIKSRHLKTAENQSGGAQDFADKITAYLTKVTVFEYINALKTVSNIGNTAALVFIVLSVILTVVFALLVYSLASKIYRAIRSICFSVFGASLLNVLLVLFVQIVKLCKDLVIYPSYLCDSVLRYVDICTLSVLFSAAALFTLGMVLTAFAWRLRRNNN